MKFISGILSIILVLSATSGTLQAATVAATVASVTGDAYMTTPSGAEKKLAPGSIVPVGSTIHTDANGTVGLKLVPGATTVLAPSTDIKVSTLDYSQSQTGTKTRKIGLALRLGTLFSSLAKNDGASDFRVTTPDGVAAARGTDWAVSYSPSTGIKVSVVDGTVTLILPNGTSVPVPGGTFATSADGTTIVSGDLTQAQITAIIDAIEAAGFTLSGTGTGGTDDDNGAGTTNPGTGSNNPANIVSPNQ